LEVDELDAELAVEAVLDELAESTLCSARSRVCRSLLSLDTELDGGGLLAGGGPAPGGGGGGGPPETPPTELADDAEVALELDAVASAALVAASSCCSSCHSAPPPDEPTDPMDMTEP
jgi:hypothetical protein